MGSILVIHKNDFKNIIDRTHFDNNILPIRPIILGGDDVTFVCHGKLGIWFAEKFMESFSNNKLNRSIPFSSCAGVATVKTKYPFYRAYELAEKLCDCAKKSNKDYHGGNWIDFQLVYSGLGNTLKEVREIQYNNIKGFYRPYCLEQLGQCSFNELKKYSTILKETLPNSKIKDLREMLTRDTSSLNDFIEHLKHQHDDFKSKFNNNSSDISKDYPFFDMIELIELYPIN